jgi:hypothetical protein
MAIMAHTRSNGRVRGRSGIRTSPRTGAVEIFTRPEQHWFWRILGAVVRFRAELATVTVVVAVYLYGRGQIGPDATTLVLITISVVVLVVPVSRRFTVSRVWCVITRHRVRACLVKTRTMTHHGRTPYLLWARPSPVGERLRVWLPAGLSVKDLERVTAELATACWARESRITAVRSQAALVVVDIVRRDPLSASQPFTPSLIDDLDHVHGKNDNTDDGTVVPLPARSTVAPPRPVDAIDTGTPAASNGTRGERKSRTTSRNGSTADPAENTPVAVTGYGGVDVSDYV